MKDMPNLDLLRSMAVLLVIVGHVLEAKGIPSIYGFNYGFTADLGVAIFFVHTCLVLMWSLERNPDTLGFYVRRIFRIYPLSILVVLLIVSFHIPVGISPTAHFTGLVSKWQFPANLFLVQNLFLLPNVMGPLWTLPLELQMYLLLPFLFYFVRSNIAFWPLITLWIATCVLNYHHKYGLNYLITVIPFFLPGVIAYVGFKRVRPILPGWLMPISVLTLVALVTYRPSIGMEAAFALVLGLILPLFRQIRSEKVNGASLTVARYSYGAYLSHPFAILLGFVGLSKYPLSLQLAAMLIFLVTTIVPAYHFIEAPMIKMGGRLARRIAVLDGVPLGMMSEDVQKG